MMWNKLLLTEFVIYLCCLVGLMLLVFEFYRPFSFLFFPLLWNLPPFFLYRLLVCTQLGCFGNSALMTKSVYFWKPWKKNNPENAFSELVASLLFKSATDTADKEQSLLCSGRSVYFKRRCRFGLADVTGCNIAKSPLHWWIMTPRLAISELLF